MNRAKFADPPALYRPIAFWSLNDRLEKDELERQIDGMKAAGWGGFFFHARGGLETPYMSEEWLDLFGASAEAARERGMNAWLYDENGWPSGTCGALIAGLDPAFRETHLFFAFDRIPHDEADVLWKRCYLTDRRPGRLYGPYKLDKPAVPTGFFPVGESEAADCPADRRVLWIYAWRAPACNPRFGGKSYVDLMNPDVADAFFASTHEKYAARFAADMGRDKLIPGVFTDDLTIKWDLMGAKGAAVPWTLRLPERFEAENGYDILDRLPDLFFDTPTAMRTRADYIRLVTRLFADGFVGRIARLCEPYGLAVTGHLMGNEGLYSDAMLQYYYEGMPAVDHLSCGRSDFRKLRRIRSVADQFGKPATLCEAFAGAGHDLTLEAQRRQTDYLCLGGITTVVPHVAQYSMRGTRKFDHPPTFSDHDPWWRVNAPLADYQARLGCVMAEGESAARVLVIDPIESKYIAEAPGARAFGAPGEENRAFRRLDALTDRIEQALLGAHCEFAYGSEELLARFGAERDGGVWLGRARYDTVILPACLTLRHTTLDLLAALLRDGGRVLAIGNYPTLCDGEPIPDPRKALAGAKLLNADRLAEAVADRGLTFLTPAGERATNIHTAQRWSEGRLLCFALNRDDDRPAAGVLRLPCPAAVEALCLYDGTAAPCTLLDAGEGAFDLPFDLAPGGSCLWEIAPAGGPDALFAPVVPTPPVLPQRPAPVRTLSLPPRPRMTPDAPNVLLIDRVRYAADGAAFGDETYTPAVPGRGPLTVRAVFSAEGWDGTGGSLLLEDAPGWASVTLNGAPLCRETGRRFFDRSTYAMEIDGLVREGENTVELTLAPGARAAVQPLYVTGPFGVYPTDDGAGWLIRGGMPTAMTADLTREGMPFYLGTATLDYEIELSEEHLSGAAGQAGVRCLLSLCGVEASALSVRVNGGAERVLFDRPYETDVTDLLRPGENRISVTLYGSLRNFLGPHHVLLPSGTPFITPASFAAVSEMTAAYSVIPFGLGGGELCFFAAD